MSWTEQRRAPRTTVDVEARLSIPGQGACQGVILNLSFAGNLFLPERSLDIPAGGGAHMRFAMPSSRSWLEPLVQVRRAADFILPSGQPAQAIGFEFLGLSHEEERAIGTGCVEWEAHRQREYPLSARCYLKGLDVFRHFSRYGRLTSASHDVARVSVAETRLPLGTRLRLKVDTVWVSGKVEEAKAEGDQSRLLLRLEPEWGRDFFLHEARR